MSPLPRVIEHTRETIAREFDDLGPSACLDEISKDLKNNNPELLDMALKCATDVGNPGEIMVGFSMFYRLLIAQSPEAHGELAEAHESFQLHPLPRVTPHTRALIVRQLDASGAEKFTRDAIEELERSNPELLQMADAFAARHQNYLGIMQGFALLYASLVTQSAADRSQLQ